MILVAAGGALGALARYGTGLLAGRALGMHFPWGTLIVNVVGCLIMGAVLHVLAGLETRAALAVPVRGQLAFWHKAVAIGFLGALTTFSTFGADTIRELQAGRAQMAVLNVLANVTLSLVAVWLGMMMATALD
jgi:CrcB protein